MTPPPDLARTIAAALAPARRARRFATACAIAAAVASVLLLGVSGWFLTGAAIAGAAGAAAVAGFNYLIPSAAIRLLAIVRTIAHYGERLLGHSAALSSLARIRTALFAAIATAPDPRRWSAGDATARLTQDIAALEDRLVRAPIGPGAIAGGIAGVALAALTGWPAALALAAILIALPLATLRLAPRWLDHPARAIAQAHGRLTTQMTAAMAAAPEIAAYAMQRPIADALMRRADTLDAARLRFARREAAIVALGPLAGGAAMAAMLLLGHGPAPLIVLAMLAAAAAVEAQGGWLRGVVRDALARSAFTRLAEMADAAAAPAPPAAAPLSAAPAPFTLTAGGVALALAPGDRVAILGRSGAGKTRLIEWLAGLDPAPAPPGAVAVSGLPGDATARRALFALAPQDAMQISGTIADNLRLARPGLSDADLWAVLDVAGLAAEVRGLDQWIGDGGARLSGGQRKRLALARALLAARPWLLLDEPSEGLDAALETRLTERLDRWLAETGTGLILVSHRPAPRTLCARALTIEAHSMRANVATGATDGAP
jgi:ATP-binding cassette subfamily C protein CydC